MTELVINSIRQNRYAKTPSKPGSQPRAKAQSGVQTGSGAYARARVQEQAPVQAQAVRRVRVRAEGRKRFYDFSLLFCVIFLFAFGLLVIYSGSQYAAIQADKKADYFFMKQLKIGSGGLLLALFISLFDYRLLESFRGILTKLAFWGSIGLCTLAAVFGIASHGKSRWYKLLGVAFQPAELVKLGLIVYFSYFIARKGSAINKKENIIRYLLLTAIPVAIVMTQNISTAFIIGMISMVMLFIATRNVRVFAGLGTLSLAALLAAKPLIRLIIIKAGLTSRPEKYYLRRIFGWACPDIFPTDAYQTMQGLYAIGSGGITGSGLGESIQKFGKIPEVQNDMIFTVLCEELGFIGAATVIILFCYLLFRIYKIAINASNVFGTMLCGGVMAHIGIQAVLNIAVVTGVIPNTGVTLPFISCGGTAVLLTMAEIGMVLSVSHSIYQDAERQ